MPGRAVHPDASVMCAKNDAVVAQDVHTGVRFPKLRRCALPIAGMSEEQMAAAALVGNPNRMNFNAFAARQPMNHEKFVERIFQRIDAAIRIEIPCQSRPPCKGSCPTRRIES